MAGAVVRWLLPVACLVSGCAAPPPVAAPPCSDCVTKWPGTIWFPDYEPPEVHQLSELPEQVRLELAAHLRERLGTALFAELTFAGGQAIDRAKVLQDDPDLEWRVPDYHLHFLLSRPAACFDYYAEIDVDAQGRVINEIDLPDVAAHGGELRVVSLDQAFEAVWAAGHSGPLSAEIEYQKDLDAIVWVIEPSNERVQEGDQINFVSVIVDARDGTIVDTVNEKEIE
jgi:hypothetical protein